MVVIREDLANWAPDFTEIHHRCYISVLSGFRLDQRSENPNHPSPLVRYIEYNTLGLLCLIIIIFNIRLLLFFIIIIITIIINQQFMKIPSEMAPW